MMQHLIYATSQANQKQSKWDLTSGSDLPSWCDLSELWFINLSISQTFWVTRFVLAMGRPRKLFLDIPLPENQKERRKVLQSHYNHNRSKTPKQKAPQGRPRKLVIPSDLPENQKERRKILQARYNRNRQKKPKRKTEKAPQGRAEEAPAMPVAGEQVCGCSCQSAEVHYVTNELYQLNMRHKNVINENTGLKCQIEGLKRTIYWLENNVKSLQNELRKRPRIEEVKHLIEELWCLISYWWRVSTSSLFRKTLGWISKIHVLTGAGAKTGMTQR